MDRSPTIRQGAARRVATRPAVGVAMAVMLAACGHSGSTATTGATKPVDTVVAKGTPVGGSTTGGQTAAVDLQSAFEQVVQTASPSVVLITTPVGLGSGIVLDSAGHIVTNAHVVGTSRTFKVTLPTGESRSATLVASYPPDDLAVIDAQGSGFKPATFADSSKLRVGDIVFAMGNPLGLQSSVTQGIVSALGRTVSEPGGAALPSAIQTSASINPGNSGGALVDLNGRVIGIPTLAASDPQMGGAAPGIGFAISSNRAADIAGQMVKNGRVVNSHRAFLGVSLAGVTGQPGAIVGAVEPGGPAAKAGIQPGDQILSIDGTPTPDASAVAGALATKNPGARATVRVVHQDGKTEDITVTLGQLPG